MRRLHGMKVIVLTRGDLQDKLQRGITVSERGNPNRKVAVDLAEVSSAHSTEEMINNHGGKGQTVSNN